MRDILTIVHAEFLRKIRSRPFLVGTAVGMFTIGLLVLVPSLIARAGAGDDRIVLAGPPELTSRAASLLRPDFRLAAVVPPLRKPPSRAELEKRRAGALLALVRTAHGIRADLYTRDAARTDERFERDLGPLNVALATNASDAGIDDLLHVNVVTHSLDTKFADAGSARAAKGVAYGLVFLLYLSIIFNSQIVMTSVAEEKTNRVAELLVAAVLPSRLLAGKILAAAAVAVVQLVLWLGTSTLAGVMTLDSIGAGAAMTSASGAPVSASEIGAFAAFFAIGFVQFATLYAGAASLISRTEDLGSVAAPLIMPVLGAFLLAQYALTAPNAPVVAVVSELPLVAPFVMFTRIAVTDVPPWQIGLSLAINLAATVLIVFAAAKLYRVGMLLYGRTPGIAQVIAALRA